MRSSSSKPVKTTESVSLGMNLRSAEGTSSSSSKVRARSPGFGKWGTTRGLGMAGEISSNSKPGCFRADVTNCNKERQHTLVGSYKPETAIDRLYCKKIGINIKWNNFQWHRSQNNNIEQLQDSVHIQVRLSMLQSQAMNKIQVQILTDIFDQK